MRRQRGNTPCEACGATGYGRRILAVRVQARSESAGDVGTLDLCEWCRVRSGRTWRLRWDELPA